jgi:hypothetical protein
MGEGLKRASRAAEASRHRAQAARGCGCVFCDLELKPDLVDGVWIHRGKTLPDVRCAIRNSATNTRRPKPLPRQRTRPKADGRET